MVETFRKWKELKELNPNYVILCHKGKYGDYYESYKEDAETIARVLDLLIYTIDSNGKIKATSFPHSELDAYLPMLIHAGLKVGIYGGD